MKFRQATKPKAYPKRYVEGFVEKYDFIRTSSLTRFSREKRVSPLVLCIFIFVPFCLLFSGCASPRPVLYPNAYLKKVGKEHAGMDIDEALKAADQYGLKSSGHGDDIKDTVTDTGVGTAAGAAAGAIAGRNGSSVGVGAAAGAAGGAAAGTTRVFFKWLFGMSEPSTLHKRFVEKYLHEKGYEIIGWE